MDNKIIMQMIEKSKLLNPETKYIPEAKSDYRFWRQATQRN